MWRIAAIVIAVYSLGIPVLIGIYTCVRAASKADDWQESIHKLLTEVTGGK